MSSVGGRGLRGDQVGERAQSFFAMRDGGVSGRLRADVFVAPVLLERVH